MLCLKTKILLGNKLKFIRYIITLHVEKRRERERRKKKKGRLYTVGLSTNLQINNTG